MSLAYSDQINHALAFAAKYYLPRQREGTALSYATHPAHMAVILARYDCDEHAIIAGVLHPVLAATLPEMQHPLRHKIAEKFGSSIIATLSDAYEPRYDARGSLRPWNVTKLEYLGQLEQAQVPALDVCAASEIHQCGSAIADVRRLGPEYLPSVGQASGEELLWWYRSLIEAMDRRTEWPNRRMLQELRLHAAHLARQLSEFNGA